MAAKLPVWGIDLGQCALKAVKLQASGDKVELQEVFVHEHPQMLTGSEADTQGLIRSALEALLAKHDVRKEQVVITVPGQITLTRFAKMPPVEMKKIPDMVNYEAQQQIPFDMDEVVWDYEILSPKDSPDVEVGIFAIRKELVRAQLAHYTAVGIQPMLVQSAPLATFNTLKFDGQLEGQTTLLMDIGAQSIDLIIVEGSGLWSRVIPMGGNSFTDALVKSFKLAFPKAEALKRTAATSKYARQILQAMRPVFADLVGQVQQSIGFYTSTRRQSEIQKVIGLGRAFGLPGLQKFLQQNLQLQVDRFAGFSKIDAAAVSKTPGYSEFASSLSVAVGAALQGLGVSSVTSSLMPVEVIRQQMWKKKRIYFAASAACVAGAAGAIWLGNMMAANALAAKSGEIRDVTISPIPLERAKQIVQQGAPREKPPLEAAVLTAQAMETLKTEFGKQQLGGDYQTRAKTMAELLGQNVIMPQIVDLIERVFKDAASPQMRGLKSSDEYVSLAKQVGRPERTEVWIESVLCKYDPKDATKAFLSVTAPSRGGATEEAPQESATAGWAIIIRGRTSLNPTQAAGLVDDIVAKFKVDGRRKDRTWWVKDVRSDDLGAAGKKGLPGSPYTPPAAPTAVRPGSRDEGRGAAPAKPGVATPPPKLTLIGNPIDEYKPKPGIDCVTGEPSDRDSTFRVTMVVIRGRVPDDMLPKPAAKAKPGEKSKVEAPDAKEAAPAAEKPVERD